MKKWFWRGLVLAVIGFLFSPIIAQYYLEHRERTKHLGQLLDLMAVEDADYEDFLEARKINGVETAEDLEWAERTLSHFEKCRSLCLEVMTKHKAYFYASPPPRLAIRYEVERKRWAKQKPRLKELAAALRTKANQSVKEQRAEPNSLAAMLEEVIDMSKDFQYPMTLKEMLGQCYVQFQAKGKELRILVDSQAFKDESPDAPDIYEAPVSLPPFKAMTLGDALKLALRQASPSATYVVYRSFVEITTIDKALNGGLLPFFFEGGDPTKIPTNDKALNGAFGGRPGGFGGFGGGGFGGFGGGGFGGGAGGFQGGGFQGGGGFGWGGGGFGEFRGEVTERKSVREQIAHGLTTEKGKKDYLRLLELLEFEKNTREQMADEISTPAGREKVAERLERAFHRLGQKKGSEVGSGAFLLDKVAPASATP